MKVLKVILIIVVVIVGAICIIPAFLPSEATIERSITVNTGPKKPFMMVNDLKNWEKWSPWYKLDTTSKIVYSETAAGVGAWYTWDSEHPDVRNGKLTITKSEDAKLIEVSLAFGEWEPNSATYTFEVIGENETKVTNKMDVSTDDYFGRYIVAMMSSGLKDMFDQGLKGIKEAAEAMPDLPEKPESVGRISAITEIETQPMFYLSKTDSIDSKAISTELERIYGEIFVEAGKQGLTQQGAPFTIYHTWNPNGKSFIEPGIPMGKMPAKADGFNAVEMKPTKVLSVDYFGPYEGSEMAHNAVYEHAQTNGYEMTGSPWEVYVTDPATVDDPMKIQTTIYYPVKRKAEATQ